MATSVSLAGSAAGVQFSEGSVFLMSATIPPKTPEPCTFQNTNLVHKSPLKCTKSVLKS